MLVAVPMPHSTKPNSTNPITMKYHTSASGTSAPPNIVERLVGFSIYQRLSA